MSDDLPENPLPACPDTPNCVRSTRFFETSVHTLYVNARAALGRMAPARVNAEHRTSRVHAVFRVLYVFKDDVHLLTVPHRQGAVLHIRSASRVSGYDFGVNRRRVRHFFTLLEEQLAQQRDAGTADQR